jgi:hypothetical protein
MSAIQLHQSDTWALQLLIGILAPWAFIGCLVQVLL